MPLQDSVLISYKAGVVELTTTVTQPERDEAESFGNAVNARLFDHQYQAMTDPAILNPINLAIASCVLSRDPLQDALKDVLLSMAFEAIDSDAGGVEEKSMFTRFQRPRRNKLEKWRTMYLRANDISSRLANFEETVAEEFPKGDPSEISESGSNVLIAAARTCLKLLLAPTFECVGQLERLLVQERAAKKGRFLFHPAVVKALTCFVAQTIIGTAPGTVWSRDPADDEAPLLVEAPKGGIVRSDPEFRVVNFVAKGAKEMLTAYIESVLRQSLTSRPQS